MARHHDIATTIRRGLRVLRRDGFLRTAPHRGLCITTRACDKVDDRVTEYLVGARPRPRGPVEAAALELAMQAAHR